MELCCIPTKITTLCHTAALPLQCAAFPSLHSSSLPQDREIAGIQPRKLHVKLEQCLNYEIFMHTFIVSNSITQSVKLNSSDV